MAIEDLRIYQEAGALADETANIVVEWSNFHKSVLGIQLCRAVDSIGNNISEGYGRSTTGDKIQFMFYADASIYEARNQFQRAFGRDLITDEVNRHYRSRLRGLSIAVIEFCASLLNKDPDYKGQFRQRVEKRRAWLVKKQLEKSQSDSETNSSESHSS